MSQPFIGDIRMFAGHFSIHNYAFCNGAILPVSQNEALYSLLGTMYGGDGRTTFALPEMRGRIPVHPGTAPGQSMNWPQGAKYGSETVTLTADNLPSHNHAFNVSDQAPTSPAPSGSSIGKERHYFAADDVAIMGELDTSVLAPEGQNGAHENIMPISAINFIIALKGVYPSRN